MLYVSIVLGFVISFTIYAFVKAPPFFGIILGVIIACNITKKREVLVSVSIALLMNVSLFLLLITSGLYDNAGFRNQEFLYYLINLVIAVALGFGYSKSREK